MKKINTLYLMLFFLIGLVSFIQAQDDMEYKGMSLEEYKKLKSVEIKNLEKDSYLKLDEGFILDRENPPYTFKFSDNILRKIYVFKIFETEDLKSLGLLAVFTSSEGDKALTLPIPNSKAVKEAWGLYIDDIKDYEKISANFATCLAFMLTKEGQNVSQGDEEASGEEEYEYCFPANAQVMMADGTNKAIADIQEGDMIFTTKADQIDSWKTGEVEQVVIHQKPQQKILRLVLSPEYTLSASIKEINISEKYLEATPNHPVLTQRGRMAIEEVQVNDLLYQYNSMTKELIPFKVLQVIADYQEVDQVYNLKIEGDIYLINNLAVYEK